ncbi:hypothetical protein EB230_17385 [Mesorhizobium sp. NZP2234]|uniref:hypothetical protein n=1 Tax=Mesorhizobium sp. NZP2234 TaxID=2483402 RepID=UPI0015524832|nr:hypothetical protein [Mesorhizobium sp. NZP2234]QKC89982.1 hypothetical protein EB230_17385 [Mesorhizobium sp. NZP2234]
MSKHTQGPWVAGADGKHRAWIADLHNGLAIWTERRFAEGEAYEWGDRVADGNLMAAAPELLAAAKSCLAAELARRTKLKPGAPATTYCERRIAALVAAIAKAEAVT